MFQQLKRICKSTASYEPLEGTSLSSILRVKSEKATVQPAQLSLLQDRVHSSSTTACCYPRTTAPFGPVCTASTLPPIAQAPSTRPKHCESQLELPATLCFEPASRAASPTAPPAPPSRDDWLLTPPPSAGSPPPDPFHDDWPFW